MTGEEMAVKLSKTEYTELTGLLMAGESDA